ncbi:MAG: DUF6600 domain-containing protein [Luteolibacter sp.]
MKNPYLIPVAALALLFTPGCERKSSETAKHLQELQRKANEAEDKQKDLERQLEEQKAAAERDAIERDRQQIENDRADLAREQGDAAAAKAEEIRKREEALANREGKLEQVQADLEDKQSDLSNRGAQLNDRERDLAGREALPFQDEGQQTEPVGDYGNFYDSLSSYGSWFETPDYGYVWQPVVVSDSNWRPYCRGRWVCTDRGWTWVSDEPFGWATHHYGRWALVRNRGWVWVPGTEWAPCWVSWRENGSHIGWAPLPPETMAYRNHRWDSSVDVQFGISAGWFTFVEYRYFGSPLYQHCLPLSQNLGCYGSTTNITYIHFENQQVICGGPRYKDACDRFGRPIPFCRLVIDRHPRPGGNVIGIRPQIKGDRLLVSAPNMDADWNGSLKPGRIKGRMDTMVVERNEPLRPEIADRYKKNREENLRIADRSIQQMGGADNFRQRRIEQLDENRKQVVNENRVPGKNREAVKTDDPPQTADVRPQVPERIVRPEENRPNAGTAEQNRDRESVVKRPGTQNQNDPGRPGIGTPGSFPREGLRPQQRPAGQNPAADAPAEPTRTQPRDPKEQVKRPEEQPRVDPQEDTNQRQRQAEKMREDQQKQTADLQQQRENGRQRQQEQARQQQEQAKQDQQPAREEQQRQRQAEQARDAQKQAVEAQREQVRQRQQAQEDARQQQQEQARQEQAQQQREMERSRQQQEDNQRQQEQARQRQQDDNQRQRQQQEKDQKDQKDQDEQRKRNR